MRQFLPICILCLFFSSVFSQKISGDWRGEIDVQGSQIPIVFHFYKDSTGSINGTWDSPKQNAKNLPFSQIKADEDSVHLAIQMISGSYNGKFINNDSIAGIWQQGVNQIPLNFSHTILNNDRENASSMHPGGQQISINTVPGITISGTLLSKNNHQKLAIIVAGSGPTDRNGNGLGVETNDYKMLAWSLDSQNIATFRYDKRGVAKSASGNIREDSLRFDDYVTDLERIFDYIHDTLQFKDIYFIGHSEGSLVSIIASQKKKVKGFISVAGAGRPVDVILKEQMQKQHLPDSVKQQVSQIFDQLKNGKQVDDVPQLLSPLFRKSVQPYMISWLKYSPEKEIKKLSCPVLILQGSCDIQVKIEDAENLHKANKKSILEIIPSMSHTLKNAGVNCDNQQKTYTDSSMPIDKKLVKDIVGFIEKGEK
ncbi:MAG: alpha/beta fold hydrolase [Ginsengibacter sp.]